MINTVIFDLDGLLVDSEISFLDMYNILLGRYGKSLSKEDYIAHLCGKTLVENMKKIVDYNELPLSYDEAFRFITDLEKERVARGYPLKDGARELLHYLKDNGYTNVLATSSVRERALTLLKGNGVDHLFDAFVCKEDVTKGKPDPQVFLKALEVSGAAKEESLVLEDSQLGVEASYNAGIKVICVPDLVRPDDEHVAMATKVFSSLHEVIDYLKEQ